MYFHVHDTDIGMDCPVGHEGGERGELLYVLVTLGTSTLPFGQPGSPSR